MIEGLLALVILCLISIAFTWIIWMPIFIAAEWIGDFISWLKSKPTPAIELPQNSAE
jgi:hypothetical protein